MLISLETRDYCDLDKSEFISNGKLFLIRKQSNDMNLDVEDSKKEEIGNAITSADSPVGIDAKKTHIIIINKLLEIEKRLDKLEKK